MRIKSVAFWSGIATSFAAFPAFAQSAVGKVTVCYYSTECNFANTPGLVHPANEAQIYRDRGEHQAPPGVSVHPAAKQYPPVDAPAFKFTNTGTTAITDASFIIGASKALNVVRDSFHIGTIKPRASFTIVPGASNDKKVHPTGGFFTFSAPGNPLDTSDSGPDDNALKFQFVGKVGTQTVKSPVFEPGKYLKPSTDGTVASLNFLGGPENADGPCADCYPVTLLGYITVSAGNPTDLDHSP